jgi:hypothetical protein
MSQSTFHPKWLHLASLQLHLASHFSIGHHESAPLRSLDLAMTHAAPQRLGLRSDAGMAAHWRASLPPPSMSPSSSLRPTFLSSECSFDLSSSSSSAVLSEWMYWQRDGSRNPHCWTKVFAVLRREFLWLFKQEAAPRSVLVQLAVANVEAVGPRQLRITDPSGEDVDLWLLRDEATESWLAALEDAAASTHEFFDAHPRVAQVNLLPRESFYRGTLVEFRRVSRRERCRRAVHKVAESWRRHLHITASVEKEMDCRKNP